MNVKTAVLVQAHNNIDYILSLAKLNPEVDFYVHIDNKNKIIISSIKNNLQNLYFVPDDERIDVYWGDYSQIEVTLHLLEVAYGFREYDYYHIISAECVPLKKFIDIESEWSKSNLEYIECKIRKSTEWRIKTKVYHTRKKWMRKIRGKLLNRIYMIVGYYFNFSEFKTEDIYFGSQWFSITKRLVSKILELKKNSYFDKFINTSCPDEHAFQMAAKLSNISVENDNRRYIIFEKFSSSPSYLDERKAMSLIGNYWFIRKMNEKNAIDYINNNWGE